MNSGSNDARARRRLTAELKRRFRDVNNQIAEATPERGADSPPSASGASAT